MYFKYTLITLNKRHHKQYMLKGEMAKMVKIDSKNFLDSEMFEQSYF